MRIERCSDSELHCFLSKEDLQARNLRLDSLAYGNAETTALIRDLMNWASYKFNFNPDHIPLMIEAVPVAEDSLLIIIKTVSYPEELDSRFSDFLDSPDGSVYADDDEDFDEDDDDFWPDDEDGYGYPGYSQPAPPPVPKKVPGAHEIIEQFTDNAQVLKEASDAISKLAENVIQAAGDAVDAAVAAQDAASEDAPAQAALPDGDVSAEDSGAASGNADSKGLSTAGAAEAGAGATASKGRKKAGSAKAQQDEDAGRGNAGRPQLIPGATGSGKIMPAVDDVSVSGEVVDASELAEEAANEAGQGGNAASGGNAGGKGIPMITPENFAEVLQKILDAARKSGATANYIRMFRFGSLDEIADIAPFIASFYRGVNYLYRDGSVYHLLVSMDGESPLAYNKLINVLNEFAVPEPVNVETTSFLDEHDNLILADHAIQKLAEVSKG